MYRKNAINYGLDRQAMIESLGLSGEESDLLADMEKYLLPSGYYDVPRIMKDSGVDELSITAGIFFQDEEEMPDESDNPTLALASKIERAWDALVIPAEKAQKADEEWQAEKRIANAAASLTDYRVAGWDIQEQYDDEENAPSGYILHPPQSDPYADQIGIDG